MDKNSTDDAQKDTVEFVAENGETMEFEVVDYFLYDGEEYVILADMGKNPDAMEDEDKVDVFIMKVNIIDDDNEEFVPIPLETEDDVLEFAEKLLSGELPNEDELL